MMHESFYTSGRYSSSDIGVHIGWTCHEGSFSVCMPVWNTARNICVIFCGEEFSQVSNVACPECRHVGGTADAGYLAALYEKVGVKFAQQLNGAFSGVVVDLRKRVVILFNDRYGLGRIYYRQEREQFYFASEAKSLLGILPALRCLDPYGVAETFACGSVLQDRTIFSGISLLPGASAWSFDPDGRVRKERYFAPDIWEAQPTLNAAEFYQELKQTLVRILPRYMGGCRPCAMSMTGGLDGRIIMALAKLAPGNLPCYTFGSTFRDSADVRLARRVAHVCNQSHVTIVPGREFLSHFADLAEKAVFISDGTMDVTGSVELYVNQIARRIAPVRVTGNYGSEIMRSNVAFRPLSSDTSLLQPEFAKLVDEAGETYQSERLGHKLSFIAFKQIPWHHYARLSVEQSQLTIRSPYLDNELVSLMYRAPAELLASKWPWLRLIHDGNAQLGGIPTDRGLVYRPAPVIGGLRRLCQEFMVRAEYSYDYGMPSWLAKLDRMMPLQPERVFLGRHKFYHFRTWYRNELSGYAKQILTGSLMRQNPYLRAKPLEDLVTGHIKGTLNCTLQINRALTLELTQRQLIDRW